MLEFAATIRDTAGDVVGTTDASTICWSPRKPSAFMAHDEESGDATILPCHDCPGCRELERRRLAQRLAAQYASTKERLWLIALECSISSVPTIRRALSRTAASRGWSGFYRLGPASFAVIAAGSKPTLPARIIRMTSSWSVETIVRPGRTRAWRRLTRGMLVARSDYGEQVKRFYHRGLPQDSKRAWSVSTRGGLRKRHTCAAEGVRAHRDGKYLYPPEAWRIPRLHSRSGPDSKRWSGLTSITDLLSHKSASVINRRTAQPAVLASDASTVRKSPGGPKIVIDGARAPSTKTTESHLLGRGYRSSRHYMVDFAAEWAERMAQKARQRGDSS